jgi:hypothetical protein
LKDIQASLFDIGHEVIRVSNILHRTTKRPLPLFRIDLKVADYNSDILKLGLLLHTRIKIELPRKKLSPPHVVLNVEKTITLQIVPNHHQNLPSVPYVRGRTEFYTKDVQLLKYLVKTAENVHHSKFIVM